MRKLGVVLWLLFAASAQAQTFVNSKGFLVDGSSTTVMVPAGAAQPPTQINSMGLLIDATGALVISPLSSQIDSTVLNIDEEFLAALGTTGNIGTYGWNFANIGGAPTVTTSAGTDPNFGLINFNSAAVSGQGGILFIAQSGNAPTVSTSRALTGTTPSWTSRWILNPSAAITGTAIRVGMIDSVSPATEPQGGYYLRFDTTVIINVPVTAGGTGYNNASVCTISSGGGSGATCSVTTSGGVITTVNITNQGRGYTSQPTIAVADGSGFTNGTVVLGDTNYQFCTNTSTNEVCYDTAVAPVVSTYVMLDIESLGFNGGSPQTITKIGMTLRNNLGVITMAEKTFCSTGGCDVGTAPAASATVGPAAQITSWTTTTLRSVVLDSFKMKWRGIR